MFFIMVSSARDEKRIVRVIRDHTSSSSHPLVVRAGEEVQVGQHDDQWVKWVWCTTSKGHSGWVPETYLVRQGDEWLVLCDYDATELSVTAGQKLVVEREESGWLWCTEATGESGWVPAENVEIVTAANRPRAEPDCPFCHLPPERIVARNELALAVRDRYPVTPLHTLVIPRRHTDSYFDLRLDEVEACHHLLGMMKEDIRRRDELVTGFNIGINQGRTAGQTIFHCHIHLIPRRTGDARQPRGGIRHVIPGKGCYREDR